MRKRACCHRNNLDQLQKRNFVYCTSYIKLSGVRKKDQWKTTFFQRPIENWLGAKDQWKTTFCQFGKQFFVKEQWKTTFCQGRMENNFLKYQWKTTFCQWKTTFCQGPMENNFLSWHILYMVPPQTSHNLYLLLLT